MKQFVAEIPVARSPFNLRVIDSHADAPSRDTFLMDVLNGQHGIGLNMTAGVAQVGVASATKMCRSIMIKGLEALTVECLLAARRYGVEEQVLASLDETFPHMEWQKQGDYLVSRVVEHGRRRAAELREVAKTEEDKGMAPLMAAAAAVRQDWIADHVASGTVRKTEKSWRAVADAILAREKG